MSNSSTISGQQELQTTLNLQLHNIKQRLHTILISLVSKVFRLLSCGRSLRIDIFRASSETRMLLCRRLVFCLIFFCKSRDICQFCFEKCLYLNAHDTYRKKISDSTGEDFGLNFRRKTSKFFCLCVFFAKTVSIITFR